MTWYVIIIFIDISVRYRQDFTDVWRYISWNLFFSKISVKFRWNIWVFQLEWPLYRPMTILSREPAQILISEIKKITENSTHIHLMDNYLLKNLGDPDEKNLEILRDSDLFALQMAEDRKAVGPQKVLDRWIFKEISIRVGSRCIFSLCSFCAKVYFCAALQPQRKIRNKITQN